MTARERGGQCDPTEETKGTAGELLPLDALRGPLELPRDAYYPRLTLMLIRALEEACRDASQTALREQTALVVRQDIALSAMADAQRAMMLSALLTRNVTDGENCLFWFALSLETACAMTLRMEDNPARRVMCFLLPEYQDALYRLANLYYLQTGQAARDLLGHSLEIMPGRPLAVCRRPPRDVVGAHWQDAGLWDEMALLTLSAAAGQSRLCCLTAAVRARDRLSRELSQEIALICQQHETLLTSLLPRRAPLDRLRTHHYLTAFLFGSCGSDETLPGPVRSFAMGEEKHALIRLRRTAELLRRAEPSARELPPFPAPLLLRPCKGCVREALGNVEQTLRNGRIMPIDPAEWAAFRDDRAISHPDGTQTPSRRVIRKMIAETGRDYRFESAPPPIDPKREQSMARVVFG